MKKFTPLYALPFAALAAISASPAHAQSSLWVANSGNDTNVCSQTSPCATFQGAFNKGNVGQINCLTSGSYGGITITTSITIDCGAGNIGTISTLGGAAITLTAASPITVVLRHLHLNGNGTGGYGITSTSFAGGKLVVQDCVIHGMGNGYGIYFVPLTARGFLEVSNSQIFDNQTGVGVNTGGGQIATALLSQISLTSNGTGLNLGGSVVAGTIRHSVIGGNASYGVLATASQVYFTIEESSIIGNPSYGIVASSAGTYISVGASTIGGNGIALRANLGSIISFGNNQISTNASDGNFTGTTALR